MPRRTSPTDLPWATAREVALGAERLPAIARPLAACLGRALAEPLDALADLPPFDTAAMDGWAVCGPGPWRIRGAVLAGATGVPLVAGEAVEVATGARLPVGTTAVLRRERGRAKASTLHVAAGSEVDTGADIRRRAQECRSGERLLPVGTRLTPPVLGLAAACGYDTLTVVERPTVDVLIVGDELLGTGLPRDGRIRDALGPMLPSSVESLGGRVAGTRHIPDQPDRIEQEIDRSSADLIVTTGGTARGPADHLHTLLSRRGVAFLVDGVRVRPGHPMLLAMLDRSRYLVGLPGNPLAAVSGVLTLLGPLLSALAGGGAPLSHRIRLADAVGAHPSDTRLIPVRDGRPLPHTGPAMLRGLALADCLAVIPPGGGVPAGTAVESLMLPG